MKLSILTIADYAAVRPDATLDIVRGGQALFVVPESSVTLNRCIAFQLFLSDADLLQPEWPVRIAIHEGDGKVIGGADCVMPSPGAGSTLDEGSTGEAHERYPAPGVLNIELTVPADGEYRLSLSVAGAIVGEQSFTVVHVPDRVTEPMPDDVVASVQSLAEQQ